MIAERIPTQAGVKAFMMSHRRSWPASRANSPIQYNERVSVKLYTALGMSEQQPSLGSSDAASGGGYQMQQWNHDLYAFDICRDRGP